MMKISSFCLIFIVGLLISHVTAISRRFNPVSRHQIQPQHSLTSPIDQSQVYWSFGGSAVLTKSFARLVPTTQGRRGWLWNEYPIETTRFDVEFVFEISSKPHFGGDGFGVWFVNAKDNSGVDVESINGSVMGMNEDFTGVGVIFDVYDNDGRRNNPMISVIQNDGSRSRFSPEKDFEEDMIRSTPYGSYRQDAYRCQADIRNVGRKVRSLVKVQEGNLHVYLNTEDGNGWKLCAAVSFGSRGGKFPATLKDMHMAFTASTGQVADAVDIFEVNTRYLPAGTSALDGDNGQYEYAELNSNLTQWILFISLLVSLALLPYTAMDFYDFRNLMKMRIDAHVISKKLNATIDTQFFIHAATTLLLLVSGFWFAFIVNVPLVVIRAIQYKAGVLHISPSAIASRTGKGFGILGMSPETRLIIAIATHLISSLYLAWNLLV